jgi:gliding motility-associated-like protein
VYIDVHGIFSSGILATEVLCYGDSTGAVLLNPLGTGPFTFLWTDGTAPVANSQNIINVPVGTYHVTITDSLGCTLQDSASVYQPAAAMTLAQVTSDVNCSGQATGSVALTVNGGSPAYTYQWSNGSTTQNITLVAAGNYSVLVTDNHGCQDSLTTTINQPAAPIALSGVTTTADCLAGIPGTIDVSVSGGTPAYAYSWNNGSTTQDISALAGPYTITVTDNNGCTDTLSFTITDRSALTIASSDSTAFCPGDSARLSASVNNGTFQWFRNGTALAGANDTFLVATQAGNYTLTVNNSCGTHTSNAMNLVVNPAPSLVITGPREICLGASTQLNASGADTYAWWPATGLSATAIPNPVAAPSSSILYSLRGTIGTCTADTAFMVFVYPPPQVSISATPYDCENGARLLATGGVNYLWTPSTGLDFDNVSNPTTTSGLNMTYFVTVTDSNSCTATDSIALIVRCDSLVIPNGISPDGNGINDTWVITGLDRYPENALRIYNRWGNLVYDAQPYRNDWKGTCTKKGRLFGQDLPDGTYFYLLELDIDKPVKTGYLEIRRR